MSKKDNISLNDVIVFKPSKGEEEFEVILDANTETVWLSEEQICLLFGKARRTIGGHIKNIYDSQELHKSSTWRESRQVQKEGNREVVRNIALYNLDLIISVGYRVNSKVGIEFRRWATQKLKEYLIKGYVLNIESLKKQELAINNLKQEIDFLNDQLISSQNSITDGVLKIIEFYSNTFQLLNRFDNDSLSSEGLKNLTYNINYDEVKNAISKLKRNLIEKGEASNLFGNEKDDSFKGILGSISQTVFGQLAYPTIEEQAAQLLYSIIKGHPFSDGNKRIGSFVFVWFLEQNNYGYKKDKSLKITDNVLTVLALAVAQSNPEQRESILKLIINMLKNN